MSAEESTATPLGSVPTGMVAVTVLFASLITDTVPLAGVGHVDGAGGGIHRHPRQAAPTGMVAVTVLVAALITDTVSLPKLAT